MFVLDSALFTFVWLNNDTGVELLVGGVCILDWPIIVKKHNYFYNLYMYSKYDQSKINII